MRVDCGLWAACGAYSILYYRVGVCPQSKGKQLRLSLDTLFIMKLESELELEACVFSLISSVFPPTTHSALVAYFLCSFSLAL